jgi:hypothetical protein
MHPAFVIPFYHAVSAAVQSALLAFPTPAAVIIDPATTLADTYTATGTFYTNLGIGTFLALALALSLIPRFVRLVKGLVRR